MCVLGESAKVNLLGYAPAVGKYIKVNDTWMEVVGVLAGAGGGGRPIEGQQDGRSQQHGVHPLQYVFVPLMGPGAAT